MLELHYAVPGVGGVLVPLNTRLAPSEYAYILEHSRREGASSPIRELREQLDDAPRSSRSTSTRSWSRRADPVERSSAPRTSAR